MGSSRVLGIVLCLVGLAGCHAGPEPTADKVIASPQGVQDEAVATIEAFSTARLPALMAEKARLSASRADMPEVVEALGADLHQPKAMAIFYDGGEDGGAFLFDKGALSPAGERVLEALSGSAGEGLDPLVYHLPKIEVLLLQSDEVAAQLRGAIEAFPKLDGALSQALAERQREAGGKLSDEALLEVLDGDPRAEALTAWREAHKTDIETLSGLQARLEVLMADGILRYAYDMKHANLRGVPEETLISKGKQAIIQARQLDFWKVLREGAHGAEPGPATDTLLAALRPPGPQYARLVEALTRYKALDDAGGWITKMPRFPVPKRGNIVRYTPKHRRFPEGLIEAVKTRLHGEGLYKGEVDGVWDEALTPAVMAYRRANQLRDRAWIDYEMLQAMKVPSDFRVAQIKVNLQRLRETPLGHDDYYIYVNVPEFFAEVWDGGERKMRFRIVVGSRKKARNHKTRQWKFLDATPVFSDKMERVVFNPYWTVPARIRREIFRKVEKDPDYLENNGYDLIDLGGGNEGIRQRPGPNNALGRVKFLFPNKHDVYMHDTPRKDLFNTDVRAYSHGCMRVEDPLDFAHYLISREDPTWTARRTRVNAHSGNQYTVQLSDGPVIHIDYITVKVEDDGLVVFMWDIYHRDIALIKEREGIEFKATAHYP